LTTAGTGKCSYKGAINLWTLDQFLLLNTDQHIKQYIGADGLKATRIK